MLKVCLQIHLLICAACIVPSTSRANNSPTSDSELKNSSSFHRVSEQLINTLADDPQWRKLLYYMDSWFLGERSLIDDEGFFLSKPGKSDPRSELSATLAAFTTGTDEQKQTAYCQFPARKAWLEQKLGTQFIEPLPELEVEICKRYKVFRTSVRAHKASLIFSSYYPGSPGSLFGHTLIKFTKTSATGASTSELLDYGLNYSAHPTTNNPLLYAFMGIAGFFPGYMSLLPYYVKVQEYNNAESRDLWEYELNLTPTEVHLALLSVFELSTRRVDYYYFDDNCSLLMLAIIDVARPSLNLVDKFDAWVAPADTVRVVQNQFGLVNRVKLRPSNVRRYLALEKGLTETERRYFNTLAKQLNKNHLHLARLSELSPEEQVKVVDALLEYVDAVEQVSASKEPKAWKSEREELLNARVQLKLVSKDTHIETPIAEAPHTAYPPSRFAAGHIWSSTSGFKDKKKGLLLGWRPTLHSLDSPTSGMATDLGITFFNVETLFADGRYYLREFTPIKIETLAVDQPHISSASWVFAINYKQKCFAGCEMLGLNASRGKAWRLFSENSRIALRGNLEAGHALSQGYFFEPGVEAQLNAPFGRVVRWNTLGSISRNYTFHQRPEKQFVVQTGIVIRPLMPFEFSLNYQLRNNEHQNTATMHWYF